MEGALHVALHRERTSRFRVRTGVYNPYGSVYKSPHGHCVNGTAMAGALTGTAFGTNLTSRRTPVRRKHYKRHVRSIGVRATVRASAVSDASQTSAVEPFTLGLRRDAEQALLLGEPIGRGAMGVVRLCTRNSDQRKFALKTIPKSGPQSLEGQTPSVDAMGIWERKVRDEVNLHFALGASLDIVTLHDAFEDEAGVHLLIDLCDGGDLLTGTANESASIKDKSNDPWARVDDDEHQEPRNESWQPFTEAAAATTIRAMLKALAACHAHGVVHRDVKPANFLYMREPNGSRRAKLSDFGLAARIKNSGDMLYVFPFPNTNTLYCPSVTFQVTNTTKD